MNIGPLSNEKAGYAQLIGDGCSGKAVGKQPTGKQDVCGPLLMNLQDHGSQRPQHQMVIGESSNFRQIRAGKEFGAELTVVVSALEVNSSLQEGQGGARRDHPDVELVFEVVQNGDIVESAIGFAEIGEQVGDKQQPWLFLG